MLVMIMTPRGTVDLDLSLDICWAVLGRITCNKSKQQVPGGVVCNNRLASDIVRVIWYHRETAQPYFYIDYSSVSMH